MLNQDFLFLYIFYKIPFGGGRHSNTHFLFSRPQSRMHIFCLPSSAHLPCCLIVALWGTGLWAGTGSNRSSSALAASLLFCLGGKCNVQTAREACQGAWSINFYLLTVFGWAHCSIRMLPKLMQRQLVSPVSPITACSQGWNCLLHVHLLKSNVALEDVFYTQRCPCF